MKYTISTIQQQYIFFQATIILLHKDECNLPSLKISDVHICTQTALCNILYYIALKLIGSVLYTVEILGRNTIACSTLGVWLINIRKMVNNQWLQQMTCRATNKSNDLRSFITDSMSSVTLYYVMFCTYLFYIIPCLGTRLNEHYIQFFRLSLAFFSSYLSTIQNTIYQYNYILGDYGKFLMLISCA